ncbi:MAG: alpha/beta fold hydrolase [Candidatus Eremiobacteraeota bacterium]|nr:alpha/beta fold hydrolase [Candidatus Eremiobacteraeota bacterium]
MTHITTPQYMPGAEPFQLDAAGATGVLLLHGFSGSCAEVRPLGEMLHNAGYSVVAPALAGHGTHPDDLLPIAAQHFFEEAEAAYALARSRWQRVYLVGLSLGGTLALHVAARHAVAGIVTIASPVYMRRHIKRGIPFAHRWSPWRRVVSNLAAWRGEVVGYRTTPTSSLLVFLEVLEQVRAELPAVRAPLLALHGRKDDTVPASNAEFIVQHVGSPMRRSRLYPSGRHLLCLPPGLAQITPDILAFLHELGGPDVASPPTTEGASS